MSLSKIPAQNVTLLDMPDLIMKKILKELQFPGIVSLRKVCHSLQNFIDENRPAEQLDLIYAYVKSDKIRLRRETTVQNDDYPWRESIDIVYKRHVYGCIIEWERSDGRKWKFLENVDFVDAFCADFKYMLSNSKLKLARFVLHFFCVEYSNPIMEPEYEYLESKPIDEGSGSCGNVKNSVLLDSAPQFEYKVVSTTVQAEIHKIAKRVLADFRKFMSSKSSLLHVHDLSISVSTEEELLEFLSYTDPSVLRELSIWSTEHFSVGLLEMYKEKVADFNGNNHLMSMENVSEMEHWKNLDYFFCNQFFLDVSIKMIAHIPIITIAYMYFSLDDLLWVKEILISYPNIGNRYLHISLMDRENLIELDENIFDSFSENCVGMSSIEKKWIFQIPDSDGYVTISTDLEKNLIEIRRHRRGFYP